MITALLMLEDGNQFYGKSLGVYGKSIGEIVFNTSMTGYQEIITDPSYYNQIVTLTYPNIGNVGVNIFDNESNKVQVAGLVIRNLTTVPSNFRCTLSLSEYLIQHNIIGIYNVDTRKLTRIIREKGVQYACILAHNQLDINIAAHKAKQFLKSYCTRTICTNISTSYKYIWTQGTCWNQYTTAISCNYTKLLYRVVVYDFGVKHNIMRKLVDYGCLLIVVPFNTSAKSVINMNPDGIFLSNGPGDPNKYVYAINLIRFFLNTTDIPIFGICLGYQLLALAVGAKTIKMKFGHHGSNHPVKDIENDKVIITAQNHNFVIDIQTLPNILKITHISLFDNTLQGIRFLNKPVFGFQGHPEASPGPHDATSIFNYFIKLIQQYRNQNK